MRVGKVFNLFILNESMNNFIKIIKSLEHLVIDGVTEKQKHEIKKQEGGFLGALLAPLVTSLVQPVTSPVVKVISGREVRRAGRGYMDKNLVLHQPLKKQFTLNKRWSVCNKSR